MKQKTFDILVYSPDEDGTHQKSINGVKASSAQELITLYGMTGEKVRILKEYDDGVETVNENKQEEKTETNIVKAPVIETQYQTNLPKNTVKSQPRYFTVGGIECKMEDGKIYQRQWIRIDNNQLDYFRLISDTNNKIISLKGKHLEQKKWILVSNEEDNPK